MPPRDTGEDADGTAALLRAAYRYASSLTAETQEAEDLVHESWLRVIERYGPAVDRPLLFRTIRNLFVDRYRHARRYPSERFDEERGAAMVEEAPGVVGDRGLAQALARLRDVEREVLFLAVVEGYTASEIARLTDTPRGTVLSLVHRTKRKLQGWLDEDEGPWPRLVVSHGGRER